MLSLLVTHLNMPLTISATNVRVQQLPASANQHVFAVGVQIVQIPLLHHVCEPRRF